MILLPTRLTWAFILRRRNVFAASGRFPDVLRIRVLGSLDAETRGTPVPLGAPRQRAVLACLLAARGAVVSVDRLAEDLWRGTPPAKATVSLHAYVSNLRRLLEPRRPPRAPATVLVTSAPGYALHLPRDAVDAWRFEARLDRARRAPAAQRRELLAEALAWWRGPAFQEYADEAWALPEAARLANLRADARELAVAADLRTGHTAEAASAAEALVGEHPCGRRAGACWRSPTGPAGGAPTHSPPCAAPRRCCAMSWVVIPLPPWSGWSTPSSTSGWRYCTPTRPSGRPQGPWRSRRG